MKIFKGAWTEVWCGHCGKWTRMQKLRLIRKFALPARFTDGREVHEFRRAYECPNCQGILLRSPK